METHIKQYFLENSQAPSVDTNAYASGDLLCEKLELSVGQNIRLNKIVVSDLAQQNAELDFIFFDSNPSGTTFTENAALDIADADLVKITGAFTVSPAHYYDFNDNSVAHLFCNDTFLHVKGKILYCAVVCRGTPTYAADDIDFRFAYCIA